MRWVNGWVIFKNHFHFFHELPGLPGSPIPALLVLSFKILYFASNFFNLSVIAATVFIIPLWNNQKNEVASERNESELIKTVRRKDVLTSSALPVTLHFCLLGILLSLALFEWSLRQKRAIVSQLLHQSTFLTPPTPSTHKRLNTGMAPTCDWMIKIVKVNKLYLNSLLVSIVNRVSQSGTMKYQCEWKHRCVKQEIVTYVAKGRQPFLFSEVVLQYSGDEKVICWLALLTKLI